MSLVIMFYFTSSVLNMFRTLIHPLSGACDFSIESPHWSCVHSIQNNETENGQQFFGRCEELLTILCFVVLY